MGHVDVDSTSHAGKGEKRLELLDSLRSSSCSAPAGRTDAANGGAAGESSLEIVLHLFRSNIQGRGSI